MVPILINLLDVILLISFSLLATDSCIEKFLYATVVLNGIYSFDPNNSIYGDCFA
jgi:hypothetical protein